MDSTISTRQSIREFIRESIRGLRGFIRECVRGFKSIRWGLGEDLDSRSCKGCKGWNQCGEKGWSELIEREWHKVREKVRNK